MGDRETNLTSCEKKQSSHTLPSKEDTKFITHQASPSVNIITPKSMTYRDTYFVTKNLLVVINSNYSRFLSSYFFMNKEIFKKLRVGNWIKLSNF